MIIVVFSNLDDSMFLSFYNTVSCGNDLLTEFALGLFRGKKKCYIKYHYSLGIIAQVVID